MGSRNGTIHHNLGRGLRTGAIPRGRVLRRDLRRFVQRRNRPTLATIRCPPSGRSARRGFAGSVSPRLSASAPVARSLQLRAFGEAVGRHQHFNAAFEGFRTLRHQLARPDCHAFVGGIGDRHAPRSDGIPETTRNALPPFPEADSSTRRRRPQPVSHATFRFQYGPATPPHYTHHSDGAFDGNSHIPGVSHHVRESQVRQVPKSALGDGLRYIPPRLLHMSEENSCGKCRNADKDHGFARLPWRHLRQPDLAQCESESRAVAHLLGHRRRLLSPPLPTAVAIQARCQAAKRTSVLAQAVPDRLNHPSKTLPRLGESIRLSSTDQRRRIADHAI